MLQIKAFPKASSSTMKDSAGPTLELKSHNNNNSLLSSATSVVTQWQFKGLSVIFIDLLVFPDHHGLCVGIL